jgi:hypothetical protein
MAAHFPLLETIVRRTSEIIRKAGMKIEGGWDFWIHALG